MTPVIVAAPDPRALKPGLRVALVADHTTQALDDMSGWIDQATSCRELLIAVVARCQPVTHLPMAAGCAAEAPDASVRRADEVAARLAAASPPELLVRSCGLPRWSDVATLNAAHELVVVCRTPQRVRDRRWLRRYLRSTAVDSEPRAVPS